MDCFEHFQLYYSNLLTRMIQYEIEKAEDEYVFLGQTRLLLPPKFSLSQRIAVWKILASMTPTRHRLLPNLNQFQKLRATSICRSQTDSEERQVLELCVERPGRSHFFVWIDCWASCWEFRLHPSHLHFKRAVSRRGGRGVPNKYLPRCWICSGWSRLRHGLSLE